MLALLVSMVISSSFSSAWDVVPNHSMIKCGEMSDMCRATRQTRTFSSRNDTRQHGRRISSACYLSLATKFGLVKRMEEQQDGSAVHVKWRCLKLMKSEHSKKLRFHFNWNYFLLKTYALPILTCNVSSDFWMAGSLRAELIACACGSWKFTCHA